MSWNSFPNKSFTKQTPFSKSFVTNANKKSSKHVYFKDYLELVRGIEPPTCGLRYRCSAIEPHQHIYEDGISDPVFTLL